MNARFALFGEVLITGVAVTLASLGLVTALPAAIAGAGHLRRHVDGEGGGVRAVAADFRAALRGLPAACAGLPVLTGLLIWNLTAGRRAGPGAVAACLVVAVLGALAVVRLAGTWTPGDPAGTVAAVRTALRDTVTDPAGSALLAGALAGALAIGWMLLPMAALAPGLVLLASLAVDRRLYVGHPKV